MAVFRVILNLLLGTVFLLQFSQWLQVKQGKHFIELIWFSHGICCRYRLYYKGYQHSPDTAWKRLNIVYGAPYLYFWVDFSKIWVGVDFKTRFSVKKLRSTGNRVLLGKEISKELCILFEIFHGHVHMRWYDRNFLLIQRTSE